QRRAAPRHAGGRGPRRDHVRRQPDREHREGGRTRAADGLRRWLHVLSEGTVVNGATVGSGLRPLPQVFGGPLAVFAACPRLSTTWQRQRDARAPATGLAPRSP